MYNNNGLPFNADQPMTHPQFPLVQVPQIPYIPNEFMNEYINIVNSVASTLYKKATSPIVSPLKFVFNKYSVNNFNNQYFTKLVDIVIKLAYDELRSGKQPNLNSIIEYLFIIISAKEVNDNRALIHYCIPKFIKDLPDLLQENATLGNRLQNIYNQAPVNQPNYHNSNNTNAMQPNPLVQNYGQSVHYGNQNTNVGGVDWQAILEKRKNGELNNVTNTQVNNTQVVNNVNPTTPQSFTTNVQTPAPVTNKTPHNWMPSSDNLFLFAYSSDHESIVINENGKLKQEISEKGAPMDRNQHLLSYLNTPILPITDTKSLEKTETLQDNFKIDYKEFTHNRDLNLQEAIAIANIHLDNIVTNSNNSRNIKCIQLKAYNNRFLGVTTSKSLDFINAVKSKKTLEKAHAYLLYEISKLNADESVISSKEMNMINRYAAEIVNDFLNNRLCIPATITSFIEDYRCSSPVSSDKNTSLEKYILDTYGATYRNAFNTLENTMQEILSSIETNDQADNLLANTLGLNDLYKEERTTDNKPIIVTIPEVYDVMLVNVYAEELGIEFHKNPNGTMPNVSQLLTEDLTPFAYKLVDTIVGTDCKIRNYLVTLDNVIYEVFFNVFAGEGYLIRLKK